MTNGPNNPNNLPEDDWAMSEPEIPIKKEIQPKPIDEKAASLYAPPDTGDLDGWDIGTQDNDLSDGEVVAPPPNFSEPTAFTPPQKAVEILKPVPPPKIKDEDWGIAPTSQNDGWKMPEPTFRVTEGEILTKVRRSSSKSNNTAPTPTNSEQENLPDIYAPPDTQEESITEDFEISETPEENSPIVAAFQEAEPVQYSQPPQTAQASAPTKSKKGLFIMLGLLFAGIFIIVLLAVFFGFFYYKETLMK
jgi:hypothetical protein